MLDSLTMAKMSWQNMILFIIKPIKTIYIMYNCDSCVYVGICCIAYCVKHHKLIYE